MRLDFWVEHSAHTWSHSPAPLCWSAQVPACSPTSLHPTMHTPHLSSCSSVHRDNRGGMAMPMGSTLSPSGGKASTLVMTQLSKIDDKEPGLQKLTAKRTPRELVCLGDSRKTSKPKDGQIGMDMGHWREDQWPSKSQSRGHRRCVWRAVAAS